MNFIKRNFVSLRILILLLIFFPAVLSYSQTPDSISTAAKKRANRAALMSAVVPGAGQIYNHKYWKLPILYSGSAALIYFIHWNNSEYKKFNRAISYRNDEDPLTVDDFPRFTNDDLLVRKNYYRRNRDLSYILSGVLYVLNIVDAYVDSQLMNFDVGDDLSVQPGSTINYTSTNIPVYSFSLVLTF